MSDFRWQQEIDEHAEHNTQALRRIAEAGFRKEAEDFARELGLLAFIKVGDSDAKE